MNRSGVIVALLVGTYLATAVPEAQAQRLGRLFTTAEERARLDAIRQQAGVEQVQPEPEVVPEVPATAAAADPEPAGPGISRLVINGVVRRSRGPATVWVNGDLVERGSISREGVSVESARTRAGGVRLRLPSGAGTVALRPGQQIDIDSGALLEAYENRPGRTRSNAFQPSPREPVGVPSATVPAAEVGDAQSAAPAAAPASPETTSRVMEGIADPESARTPGERAAIEDLRERVRQAAGGQPPPAQ